MIYTDDFTNRFEVAGYVIKDEKEFHVSLTDGRKFALSNRLKVIKANAAFYCFNQAGRGRLQP